MTQKSGVTWSKLFALPSHRPMLHVEMIIRSVVGSIQSVLSDWVCSRRKANPHANAKSWNGNATLQKNVTCFNYIFHVYRILCNVYVTAPLKTQDLSGFEREIGRREQCMLLIRKVINGLWSSLMMWRCPGSDCGVQHENELPYKILLVASG